MAEEQKGKNMIKLDMGNIDGGLSKYVEIQRGVSEMKSIKSEDMPDVWNRIFQGAKNGIREIYGNLRIYINYSHAVLWLSAVDVFDSKEK